MLRNPTAKFLLQHFISIKNKYLLLDLPAQNTFFDSPDKNFHFFLQPRFFFKFLFVCFIFVFLSRSANLDGNLSVGRSRRHRAKAKTVSPAEKELQPLGIHEDLAWVLENGNKRTGRGLQVWEGPGNRQ